VEDVRTCPRCGSTNHYLFKEAREAELRKHSRHNLHQLHSAQHAGLFGLAIGVFRLVEAIDVILEDTYRCVDCDHTWS
jgi:hypothetical protein